MMYVTSELLFHLGPGCYQACRPGMYDGPEACARSPVPRSPVLRVAAGCPGQAPAYEVRRLSAEHDRRGGRLIPPGVGLIPPGCGDVFPSAAAMAGLPTVAVVADIADAVGAGVRHQPGRHRPAGDRPRYPDRALRVP